MITEAKSHYIEALNISGKVNDIDESLRGKSAALGNIGLIYRSLGKPDEALKYLKKSLDIFKRIRAIPQVEIVSRNIEIIEKMKK